MKVSLTFLKNVQSFACLTKKACKYVAVLHRQVTREGRKLKSIKKKY